MYFLYAPVLQMGHTDAGYINPDAPQEQEQCNAVQSAYRYMAVQPSGAALVVKFPRPDVGVVLFKLVVHFHFYVEVRHLPLRTNGFHPL